MPTELEISIDPTKLKKKPYDEAKLLAALFTQHTAVNRFKKAPFTYQVTFPDPKNKKKPLTIKVALTNTIIKRGSKTQGQYRYDIRNEAEQFTHQKNKTAPEKKRKYIGKGAYGKVFVTAGTLRIKKDRVVISTKHERVIKKMIHTETKNKKENAFKEYELSKNIAHLHVKKPVFEPGKEPGTEKSYTVMQKLKGRTLWQVLKDDTSGKKVLTVEERIHISIALLKALEEQVHAKGIIHRDIKPENILYDETTKEVKIIDFGIAKKQGENDEEYTGGTNYYKAPEQFFNAQGTTVKSDSYSMAKVLGHVWRAGGLDKNPPTFNPMFGGVDLPKSQQKPVRDVLVGMARVIPLERENVKDGIKAFTTLAVNRLHPVFLQDDIRNKMIDIKNKLDMNPLEELKLKLYEAIHKYYGHTYISKNIFKSDRAASVRRSQDVRDLLNIIHGSKDVAELEKGLKQRLDSVKVGFFRQSLLKKNINTTLADLHRVAKTQKIK